MLTSPARSMKNEYWDRSLHVSFSPRDEKFSRLDLTVVVTMDILFATTTIVAAIDLNNCRIFPVIDPKELLKIIAMPGSFEVCVEKSMARKLKLAESNLNGLALRPNTPLSFLSETPAEADVVFLSSRGTGAIRASLGAKESLVASLANIDAVSDHLLKNLGSYDVVVLCAGSFGGGEAIEDFWAAGRLVYTMLRMGVFLESQLTVEAANALKTFQDLSIKELRKVSPVSRLAISRGESNEVAYAFDPPTSICIPTLNANGWIGRLGFGVE
jgi:2-phosphosulfolactate phosphatase